jgi:hypothetical protein
VDRINVVWLLLIVLVAVAVATMVFRRRHPIGSGMVPMDPAPGAVVNPSDGGPPGVLPGQSGGNPATQPGAYPGAPVDAFGRPGPLDVPYQGTPQNLPPGPFIDSPPDRSGLPENQPPRRRFWGP